MGLLKLLPFLFLVSCSIPERSSQPNILFIMADDHAVQAIGAYDGPLKNYAPTPHIDALANEGMLFKQTFSTNSICTPSRATILTGQYSQTNGVLDLDDSLAINKQYLPIELHKLGYQTAVIGKWHLKNEPAHFDYYKVLPSQGTYFNPNFREKGKGKWLKNTVKSEGHSSDVITNSVIDYLKKRDQSKPFFLMHHFKAPHGKFEYAPRYSEYLKDAVLPIPASFDVKPEFGSIATRGANDSLRHLIGTSVSERHQYSNYRNYYAKDVVDNVEATQLAYQTYLKHYLRCVKGIDDNLGRLFSYLKEDGLWENTIIVYTSDQGFMLGAHDYIDKRWMYEESMQMPLIIHYPKLVEEGQVSDLLINNTDFAPTLIDLAGGKTPEYMQGHSFTKTLKGQKERNWREATYYRYWMHMIHHYVPAHFGIRTKDYKLIYYYSRHYLNENEQAKKRWYKRYIDILNEELPVAWEFYDLKSDPNEQENRYNNPVYRDIIVDMKKELKRQRQELNETDDAFEVLDKEWID